MLACLFPHRHRVLASSPAPHRDRHTSHHLLLSPAIPSCIAYSVDNRDESSGRMGWSWMRGSPLEVTYNTPSLDPGLLFVLEAQSLCSRRTFCSPFLSPRPLDPCFPLFFLSVYQQRNVTVCLSVCTPSSRPAVSMETETQSVRMCGQGDTCQRPGAARHAQGREEVVMAMRHTVEMPEQRRCCCCCQRRGAKIRHHAFHGGRGSILGVSDSSSLSSSQGHREDRSLRLKDVAGGQMD